jgi:hypothetical protein
MHLVAPPTTPHSTSKHFVQLFDAIPEKQANKLNKMVPCAVQGGILSIFLTPPRKNTSKCWTKYHSSGRQRVAYGLSEPAQRVDLVLDGPSACLTPAIAAGAVLAQAPRSATACIQRERHLIFEGLLGGAALGVPIDLVEPAHIFELLIPSSLDMFGLES